MLRKKSIILVCVCSLLLLVVLLVSLPNVPLTKASDSMMTPVMPPPLPRGAGGWGTPIGYEDSVCCISGYVFWKGQSVTGAVVRIQSSTQITTVQTTHLLNVENNQQYAYFKARIDGSTFFVQPGEMVTLTVNYAGHSKSVRYIAQSGGQQVDVVIPDPDLTFNCTPANQTQIPASECNALVAIYKHLNGPGWPNNDGWLTTPTPCFWYGVVCNNGHVTLLSLKANQLVGTLPSELGNLPYINKVDFLANRLTGMIPQAIGNLREMYEIYLGENQLSGPIPKEVNALQGLGVFSVPHNHLSGSISMLGNLTGLLSLDLTDNHFSGSLPPELGNLVFLELLYMANNQFSGPIPSTIGKLSQLTVLELTDNRLTGGIPETLGNLTKLTKLALDSNVLTGSIPTSLGQLKPLQGLYLNVNLLTGSIPPELGNLTDLQGLNLSHNLLEGTIPASFGNLRNLAELFLDTNKLSGSIPPELGKLRQLYILFLAVNRLSGPLPPELGSLDSLEYVNISDNQLSGPIPPELGNLQNLDQLYLNSNQLNGMIPWQMSQLKRLRYLSLNHNDLSGSIPLQLGSLSNLNLLDLSHNQLTGGIAPELGNLVNLHQLELSANQLSGTIPQQLGQLTNLQTVGLNDNQLAGAIPVELLQLIGLRYLNLGFNHLSGSIPAELGNLSNLEQLGLHANQFSGVIPAQVGNLTKLRVLNLHANQLAGIIPSELRNLVNINIGWLTLSYNKLNATDPALINFIISRGTDSWAKTQTVVPTNVQAIPRSASAIQVVWQPIVYTGHSGYYEISIASTPNGPYNIHGTTTDKTSNSYTITNLPGIGTYYIRVRTYTPAHTNQQNDLWSDYVAVSTATAETTCHQLTLTHSGAGSDPVATPTDNDGELCEAGKFKPGKSLNVCAAPAPSWNVVGWTGTANDAGIDLCNLLFMPNSDHTVNVTYEQASPPTPTPIPTDTPDAPQSSFVHMIYVAGDNELDPYLGDFEEGMLRRMFQIDAQQNVTTVVLYDGQQPGDTARYIFPPTGASDMRKEPWEEVPMDDPSTLRFFVLLTVKEFAADHYALSIVDHANGALGIGYDYGNNPTGDNYLTTNQIRTALDQVVSSLWGISGRKLDVLHFDGCSFGLFEDASIAQGTANYVIASPNTGWGIFAYDEYRKLAGRSPNDPRSFAQAIAQYYAVYLQKRNLPYTISVFDMASYNAMRVAISELGNQLDAYIHAKPQASAELQALRGRVQKYDSGDILITENDYYVDLYNLASELQQSSEPSLVLAANHVLQLAAPSTLGSFVLYQSSASGDYQDDNQQIHHVNLSGASGIGIYFPISQPVAGQLLLRYLSDELFPQLTSGWGWTKFLYNYLIPVPLNTQANVSQLAMEAEEERLIAPLIPPSSIPTMTPTSPASHVITIRLDTQPDHRDDFLFTGDLGSFVLDDMVVNDSDPFTSSYTFTVSPGIYTIHQEKNLKYTTSIACMPSPSALINPQELSVQLSTANSTLVNCSFTNERTIIMRAQVYQDVNSNSQWDNGELWLQGWTIHVYNAQNVRIKSGVTNQHGKVSFTGLAPGVYTVCEELPAGWNNSQPATIYTPLHQPCYGLAFGPGKGGEMRFGNNQTASPGQISDKLDTVIPIFDVGDYEDNGTQAELDDIWLNAPGMQATIYLPIIKK